MTIARETKQDRTTGRLAQFPIFGMMLVLSVGVLSLSGCGGDSGEATEDPAAVDAVDPGVEAGEGTTTAIGVAPQPTEVVQATAAVQTTDDLVADFIERYKEVHANKDVDALADLFYFDDTPDLLVRAWTMREVLRFKRTLETIEFVDTYHQIPNDYNGDNYGPNIEVVGTLRRAFVPVEGMVTKVKDPLGIHEGTIYFPGLQLDP